MISHLQDTVTLNNGVQMPGFGLGVYKVENSVAAASVESALKHGYRSIDTASFYQNERGVGKGIRESGVPRKEIFVTSKVWNDEQGYDSTLKAFEASLEKLGLDYLDLYLIHWPVKDKYKETWKAMEKLYEEGKVRAIGVSNFHIHHLQDLIASSNVKPVINQVEYHPHLTQEQLKAFCEEEDIQLEAWSPLKRGRILDEPVLREIAAKYNKTAAQVILRWDVQQNVVTIPKSTHEHRIKENAAIFDFELTRDEMEQINSLNKNDRAGTNPDSFDKD
ncbi:aldo/keto reductase [Lentibacillus cibarius]|uniref:Aldo/keto reductase n=1 Tax=Lentibacillus cibarius TaxID=2583219 RepID=A0A549YEQ4_9BACI|nr:aldo/keto reductase [Lentibacillus cibarius]TMN21472.1 aldo/keto reductase [Lentibacillus cibarius]TRM10370.1 aldo/keto reductase [Lentibacillus cibarius]